MIPTVVTIAGSDSGGGAGLQADLKTFTSLGVFGTTVITSVTAQNTQGVIATFDLPPEMIRKQFNAIMADISPKYGKTGMLSSQEIIVEVINAVKEYDVKLVVDPVMISKTGYPLMSKSSTESIIRLVKSGILVTPNIYEAERLSGEKISSAEQLRIVVKKLYDLLGNVVVKGGRRFKGLDIAIIEGDELNLTGDFVDTKDLHGSGDVFSAAITAFLSKGMSLRRAIEEAKTFTVSSIKNTSPVGKGINPVDPSKDLLRLANRERAREELEEVVYWLERKMNLSEIIHSEGKMNVGIRTEDGDVFSLAGGIIKYMDWTKVDGPIVMDVNNEVTKFLKKGKSKYAISISLSNREPGRTITFLEANSVDELLDKVRSK
ncbi:bifunctional hydroxymethylpyrimidine kinase/phosphomethylpyrimidine kinase [Sulfolobales archaeon HS-7]|nr:bifunctional hydroxymethylpyrimidine kinase/phosphomethylpyrimidine kinase [Sulfolobales archaeon HS-7]